MLAHSVVLFCCCRTLYIVHELVRYCHVLCTVCVLVRLCVFNIPVLVCSVKNLCIVVSPERTGGATVMELSSPDGE